MPLSGFVAPVTLTGTIIQHTAETLSGLVISQLVNPGTPILYGGSPAIFDMRYETTPMGAVETMMIDCAYSEIGKFLGMPTQAYISLSDAKQLDAQAGLESGIGATLAALSGINVELYEAAAVDGASRWQQLWYITLPGILPVITIVLILRMGGVLSVGFTHIFLVQNSTNIGQSEVLDTFVYWRGLVAGNFSFATAVGLVRSSMGMLLIVSTNWLSKRLRGEEGGVF